MNHIFFNAYDSMRKRATCERTRVSILPQKRGKNDSLEGGVRKRAETEGKECWKKKKEQEDVGHHPTPPQEDAKQSERWDFAISDLKKKWKKKEKDKKDMKSRLRVCIIRFC